MTVAQFLKTEAGDRYPEVADDPATQILCEKTLAAMRQGARWAGFENDFVVFTSEDVIGPDGSMRTPTLIIHDVTDPMAPVDHVAWLAAKCLQRETVSVHTAGHLIWVGPDADVMHRARVRFLREHAKRAAEPGSVLSTGDS
jgi:pimeloyl-ACP methyl ester carboxylesterase